MEGLTLKSGLDISKMIKKKEISPVEVIETHLRRLSEINPKINAVINLLEESALEEAKKAEKTVLATSKGNKNPDDILGPLFGVPLLIKDNVETKNIKTTYGSRLFENYIPDMDAIIVNRLKEAGAILIGKTNLPEFAFLAVTDNKLFGATKNPWDIERTPGGSSGGSAAAVSAGISPLSTGNDVGGSIRIPAALCGVYGIKPTFGRIPCYPKLSGWEGLFHEGPITRNVADAAAMLDIMTGHDDRDRLSLPGKAFPNHYLESLEKEIDGLRIAYCSNLGYTRVEQEIKNITQKKVKSFEKKGCMLDEINLEFPDMLKHLQNITISDFLASMEYTLEEWKKVMDPVYSGFFETAKNITGRDMSKITVVKDLLWEKVWPVFERYDLLITPTTSTAAFPYEEGKGPVGPSMIDGQEVSRMAWMGFTYPFNFTGQPAATINCGFTEEGLPVGLQLIGSRFDEETVLRASYVFETLEIDNNML